MTQPTDPVVQKSIRRWRMVLGRTSESRLGDELLDRRDLRIDAALEYLYGRELSRRGVRIGGGGRRGASLDPSQLTAVDWLHTVRELFPSDVFETIQAHALDRYGLTELLRDPAVLESLEPSSELLAAMLSLKGAADPAVAVQIRRIARAVVEAIMRRFRTTVEQALSGRRNRFEASPYKVMRNFDWRGTIRRNLKTYDPDTRTLAPETLRFFARSRRRFPWTIVLCVDQSGSMASSVVHSAVMAAIIAGIPSLRLHLVVFDTAVVDLTDRAADPVEVLLSVQLGGGTDIGGAVAYCERLIAYPSRTIFVMVTDFLEGGSPARLVEAVRRLAQARVTMLGLAALDDRAVPDYDRGLAGRLAAEGMQIGAMTPPHFADWLAGVIR